MSEVQARRRLPQLLAETRRSAKYLQMVRATARSRAIILVRRLEAELQDALDGQTLRGLPNLMVVGEPFSGMQLRSMMPSRPKYEAQLPPDGSEVLVLDKAGWLMLARRHGSQGQHWSSRPITDDELLAEDLRPVVRGMQHALEVHLARTERTAARYDEIAEFAGKLGAAIGLPF